MSRVIIEHPKTGERYSVTPGDFRTVKHADGRTYEEQKFRIVSNEDGSPYEAPVAKTATTAASKSKASTARARSAKRTPKSDGTASEAVSVMTELSEAGAAVTDTPAKE